MIALVSGATPELLKWASSGLFGRLVIPTSLGERIPGIPWAADNGAFSGFEEDRFLRMLNHVRDWPDCLWVAAPDALADAEETQRLFDHWHPVIAAYGFPVALVAQDGLTIEKVPWERIACLFLGGTTAFKRGAGARELVAEAQRRHLQTHVGRPGSLQRYYQSMGIDSLDSTGLSRWSRREFPIHANLLRYPQGRLDIP